MAWHGIATADSGQGTGRARPGRAGPAPNASAGFGGQPPRGQAMTYRPASGPALIRSLPWPRARPGPLDGVEPPGNVEGVPHHAGTGGTRGPRAQDGGRMTCSGGIQGRADAPCK